MSQEILKKFKTDVVNPIMIWILAEMGLKHFQDINILIDRNLKIYAFTFCDHSDSTWEIVFRTREQWWYYDTFPEEERNLKEALKVFKREFIQPIVQFS